MKGLLPFANNNLTRRSEKARREGEAPAEPTSAGTRGSAGASPSRADEYRKKASPRNRRSRGDRFFTRIPHHRWRERWINSGALCGGGLLRFSRRFNQRLALRIGVHPHLHIRRQVLGELDLHCICVNPVQASRKIDISRLHIK